MKEQFIEKVFRGELAKLIPVINQILDKYRADGFDLSLRQLYYQLVAAALIENSERSYKNIGNLVSDARLAGLIDWDMIKDRGREMVENPHWDDPANFLRVVAPQFRVDLWEGQENYVEVMVEKQALEGVLIPVCRALDVPFTANKGYSSSSAMYEAGKRMLDKLRDGRNVVIIYLGDHDPSGIDMTRDVEERLRQFALSSEDDEIKIDVDRVALNMNQIQVLRPPENPAKITDSRADDYIRRFGKSSWELDAIEAKQLAGLVTKAIQSHMDVGEFNKRKKYMEEGRAALVKFADQYEKNK